MFLEQSEGNCSQNLELDGEGEWYEIAEVGRCHFSLCSLGKTCDQNSKYKELKCFKYVCGGGIQFAFFKGFLSMENKLWEGKNEARTYQNEPVALVWAADGEDLDLGSDCAYRNKRMDLRHPWEVDPTRLG